MMARTVLGAILLALVTITAAVAGTFQDCMAALGRDDYATAARILLPLAEGGDARAQATLGYMSPTATACRRITSNPRFGIAARASRAIPMRSTGSGLCRRKARACGRIMSKPTTGAFW